MRRILWPQICIFRELIFCSLLLLEYTEYINNLHEVLTEGQSLILHLSRGYKTAARVNYEWQKKMKSIIAEVKN